MRRWFPIAMYGVGGFALAVLMVWGGFAVAGRRLSTPANPIQPLVSTASTTPSGSHDDGPTASPSHHDHPASPSHTSAPPPPTVAPSSSPTDHHGSSSPSSHPPADDHSGGGGDD